MGKQIRQSGLGSVISLGLCRIINLVDTMDSWLINISGSRVLICPIITEYNIPLNLIDTYFEHNANIFISYLPLS